MRYLLVISVAVIVGWKVGENLIPPAAEPESAVYPGVGAPLSAAIVGLITSAALRRSRSDGNDGS